jgi:hypothetical protein
VAQCFVFDGDAMLPQGDDGAFQINGVPKGDNGDDQVESAGMVALVFKATITQVAFAIEEDSPSESVSGFAFVWLDLHTSAQFRVFYPFQHEGGTLDAPDFAKRGVEAVLSRLACEFADDERSRHGPVLDASGEAAWLARILRTIQLCASSSGQPVPWCRFASVRLRTPALAS